MRIAQLVVLSRWWGIINGGSTVVVEIAHVVQMGASVCCYLAVDGRMGAWMGGRVRVGGGAAVVGIERGECVGGVG